MRDEIRSEMRNEIRMRDEITMRDEIYIEG